MGYVAPLGVRGDRTWISIDEDEDEDDDDDDAPETGSVWDIIEADGEGAAASLAMMRSLLDEKRVDAAVLTLWAMFAMAQESEIPQA